MSVDFKLSQNNLSTSVYRRSSCLELGSFYFIIHVIARDRNVILVETHFQIFTFRLVISAVHSFFRLMCLCVFKIV